MDRSRNPLPENWKEEFAKRERIYLDLATLLELPKGARRYFQWRLCELEDRVSLILDDLPFPDGWKRGEEAFEEFHRGMRIALNAVGKMTADEALALRELMEARLGEKDAVEICTGIAAALVGRNLAHSSAQDWQLNAVLRDVQTWPDRFGAVGIKTPCSKRLERTMELLGELMPHVVVAPAEVTANKIKSIWKPRPTKGRKR